MRGDRSLRDERPLRARLEDGRGGTRDLDSEVPPAPVAPRSVEFSAGGPMRPPIPTDAEFRQIVLRARQEASHYFAHPDGAMDGFTAQEAFAVGWYKAMKAWEASTRP